MRIFHPLLTDALPAARVERIGGETPAEVFSLSVDGHQIATLTAFNPADEAELVLDPRSDTTIAAAGCWQLDAVDPNKDPFDTQIMFLSSQCRNGGSVSGELAAWATLTLLWSCRTNASPGCG
jgi:hypothetical protein